MEGVMKKLQEEVGQLKGELEDERQECRRKGERIGVLEEAVRRLEGAADVKRREDDAMGSKIAELRELMEGGGAKVDEEWEKRRRELDTEIAGLKEWVEAWSIGRSEETGVKRVEEVPREEGGALGYVILTDSNGRGMGPVNIEAHIPSDQRKRFDIRVETVYTLVEACDKLERGGLDVDGRVVILDVSTNDVRGTPRVPRARPDEVGQRFERVARLLFEKGAVGVVGCEVKPMNFMDVTPYSWAIHSACLRLRTHGHRVYGCQTQTGVSHLKKDGFHILPSFSTVLDRTYACAIMGVPVPCPTPSWDRYRDVNLRGEWPTPREAQGQGSSHGHG